MTVIRHDGIQVCQIGSRRPRPDALAPLQQIANIYAVQFSHKERHKFLDEGRDNFNHFTVIAVDEQSAIELVCTWYYQWSESNIPVDKYNVSTHLLVEKIITPVVGVIQFEYTW